jgi:Family of unknown function (DUF5681)
MGRIAGAVAPIDPPAKPRSAPHTAWAPGQTGNPNGRPKNQKDVVEQAKKLAPRAMRKIGRLMTDKRASPAVQLAACIHIVDRACGKPASFSTGSPDAFRKAIDMTDDELAAIVLAGKGKLLELVPNKPKPAVTAPGAEPAQSASPVLPRDGETAGKAENTST